MIEIKNLAELPQAAKQFLALIGTHKVIAFSGEMGVGKTTFIKALCAEMGVLDVASSPTFSLVNEYQNRQKQKIYHFDFYRLNKETEALDMGCDEYFYSGCFCFIEWPEKISSLLPPDCLQVVLKSNNSVRMLELA